MDGRQVGGIETGKDRWARDNNFLLIDGPSPDHTCNSVFISLIKQNKRAIKNSTAKNANRKQMIHLPLVPKDLLERKVLLMTQHCNK